jgi:glycosyltransferase involved in cell wall biosynthesis
MRIALVWTQDLRLVDITVRQELYVRGFEALGHEVTTVCSCQAAEGFPYRVDAIETPSALADPCFWRGKSYDVAVMICWHRMADILSAIRAAGIRTIALADSDGRVSIRAHPRARWEAMVLYQPRWDLKLRATKHWLQLYLFRSRRLDGPILESAQESDVLVFGTGQARVQFRHLLNYYGRGDLDRKVAIAPYPVHERFCTRPIRAAKKDQIVAIGRWDDPQKDAGLLARALRLFLKQNGHTQVLILGRGGATWFGPLARRFSQVRYLGVQSPETVENVLAESRAIVFSSRWESGPIAAWEALALGCTVIGTSIPNLRSICAAEQFGRVSPSRRPSDLAGAIGREMAAWESGRRNPEAIAHGWQARLHPKAVCATLLEALACRYDRMRTH